MIRLLRTYLAPYTAPLALVLVLLFVQAVANLYLPDLNADIINNGVVKGDTDYIVRTGALMLFVTFLLAIAAIVLPRMSEMMPRFDWIIVTSARSPARSANMCASVSMLAAAVRSPRRCASPARQFSACATPPS